MSKELTLAAVDLGASSGRVMAARVGPQHLDLTEVHRFPNRPVRASSNPVVDALVSSATCRPVSQYPSRSGSSSARRPVSSGSAASW